MLKAIDRSAAGSIQFLVSSNTNPCDQLCQQNRHPECQKNRKKSNLSKHKGMRFWLTIASKSSGRQLNLVAIAFFHRKIQVAHLRTRTPIAWRTLSVLPKSQLQTAYESDIVVQQSIALASHLGLLLFHCLAMRKGRRSQRIKKSRPPWP